MRRTYVRDNITVIEVENKEEGSRAAYDLLKGSIDEKSILFLSGGSSPQDLYRIIAEKQFQQVKPAAIATVDERWGPPRHIHSNEEMIRQTGLYEYAESVETEIHTILHGILNRRETSRRYEIVLQGLFERLRNHVAVMGVGTDGHTAGLAPSISDWRNPAFTEEFAERLVVDFKHEHADWQHSERISLTPYALRQIGVHLILIFGKKKKIVLDKFFSEDLSVENFPISLYKKIRGKVFLITDLQI